MDISNSYNKSELCRICMQNHPNLFSIFNKVSFGNKAITIAEIISECTKYPVAHNDQLPTQICSVCVEAAQNAHKFRKQTEDAYCRLKALYDITWVPKHEKEGTDVGLSSPSIDKYTQTEKSSVFLCEICPKKFFVERELREHRATDHAQDGKKCRVCGDVFNHLGQLKVHLSTEHPSEGIRCDFKCNICSREFTRKDHLKRHLIRVHKVEHNNLNITKVSSDDQQIENHAGPSVSLNNFSSHWPDYQDDDNEPIIMDRQKKESIAATNPFSSEDEGLDHHDFNDIKEFVDTIAHPEIFIKVENPDYSYCNASDKNEKDFKSTGSSFDDNNPRISVFKPEKSDDNLETKEFYEEEEQHFLNNSINDRDSKNDSSEELSDDEYDDDDDDNDSDTIGNPNKSLTRAAAKRRKFHDKNDNPTSSNTKPQSKHTDNRCKECNRTFTRYNHMLRHMLTHSDEKPHICNFCAKGFSRSDHLKKHIQSIHCEKNYKCDQCASAYGRKDHLQRHIETRHNKDPAVQKPQFDCDMCEKKFTTKAYLAKHKLLHTDRLYACKHCPETFQEKEQMKEHQKLKHTQPRNFLCNICGDSFQRNEYLKIHMRRHTGEKPYKCRFCEKGFPRSTDLKMHERYHMGHKPNLCNLCGKGFHRPYNLTIHMRTHTGEKPYKCTQCPQAFAQSNDLKAHIRRHTGERFRCDLCSAAFLQRYGLNAHLRTVHSIIVTSFTGRLRKTDQPADGPELHDQKEVAALQAEQLSTVPDQSHSSHPSPPLISNGTPSPLYTAHQYINPLPVAVPTTQTSPIDISSSSTSTLALSLPHPPPPHMCKDYFAVFNEKAKENGGSTHFAELAKFPCSLFVAWAGKEPNDIIDAYSYDDIYEPKAEPEKITPEDDEEDNYITHNIYNSQHFLQPNKIFKKGTTKNINFNNKYQRNTETNMFHCVECLLEFKLQRNLIRHMLTHTDDRPFTCHVCLKSFKRKDNLQKHLRDVHAEKQFACNRCEKKFATYRQLHRHNQTTIHKKIN